MIVKTTTEKEIEVTYPQYRKYGGTLHKLLSDKDYIGVEVDEKWDWTKAYKAEVMKGYYSTVAMIYSEGNEISEDDFNNAFTTVLSHLNQLVFMAVTTEATAEEKKESCEINEPENVFN